MKKMLKRPLSILLAVTMIVSIFTVLPVTTVGAAEVTDTLNLDFTGISKSTSYSTWSNKTGSSGAVYAGQSAGGNDSIQLRSSNNSGIITTTSSGKATKVTVKWNSNTASDRTLDIYGKNTAYTSAANLYNSSAQGTKLGSIVKGTGTELTISGDYEFIGMRSKSGAMYIDQIEIKWEKENPSASEYTVTWADYNGETLETDTDVSKNTMPQFNDTEPFRSADGEFSYTFIGWSPAITAVTGDVTYTAVYTATPLSMTGRIVKTNDGTTFNLAGKYYDYNGTTRQFSADATFNEDYIDYGELDIDDMAVADIEDREYAEFAHSVYVTGNGTEEQPFVFTPNYIYSRSSTSGVSGGVGVSADGTHTGTVTEDAVPGDGFKKYSRIKVTKDTNSALFLQHTEDGALNCDPSGYVGVGNGSYGNSYSKTNASPYTFMEGNDTLYYLGIKGENVYMFTESVPYTDLGDPIPRYTVTWSNDDGSEISSESYPEGAIPSFSGDDPVKESDEDYNYTFIGWSSDGGVNTYNPTDEMPRVIGNITYTAQFEAVARPTYTVTWYDGDLNSLYQETYKEGQKPVYHGSDPTMSATTTARYTYNGSWMDYDTDSVYSVSKLPVVTGNKTYIAQFDAIRRYEVLWDLDNGTDVTDFYDEGETPRYNGETPVKPDDGNFSYTFIGWDPEPAPLYDDEIYTAQYTATPITGATHYVKWVNYNDDLLLDGDYPAGETPVYTGETPVKPADSNTYTFIGWDPVPSALTDDAIYTAQFAANYTILWVDGDSNELAEDTVMQGIRPSYTGTTPTKASDGTWNYVFNGKWMDEYGYEYLPSEIPTAFEDQIYTACFDRIKLRP